MRPTPAIRSLCLLGCLAAASLLWGCESAKKATLAGVKMIEENPDLLRPEDREKVLKGAKALETMIKDIDTAEEIEMGQCLAVRAFASFGRPHADEALGRYVSTVGRLVALQSDRPSLPYSFAVVENDAPNALALPGGFVFVSTGLLESLHSEGELAAVLAHEVAHVAEKHGLEVTLRDRRIAGLVDFGAAVDEDVAKYREFIDLAYQKLATEGYDQRYEWMADLAGTRYAHRAGYNPEGLLPFLEESAKSGVAFEVFKTHPDPRTRIEKVREVLGSLGDYSAMPKLEDRYRREVLSKL